MKKQQLYVLVGAAGVLLAWWYSRQQQTRDAAILAAVQAIQPPSTVNNLPDSEWEPGGSQFVGPIADTAYLPGGSLFVGPMPMIKSDAPSDTNTILAPPAFQGGPMTDNSDFLDPDQFGGALPGLL
jgi:hypothetical protein